MARAKQLSFMTPEFKKRPVEFGGSLLKNSHAKVSRPLDAKNPMHLVLRSTKSCMRNPGNFGFVTRTVAETCRKHGVKLYEFANVGNHLHLLIRIRHRRDWAGFIRELTGRIAYKLKLKWDKLPFTRIVAGWRKAYLSAKKYVVLNAWEAEGEISAEALRNLRLLRQIWEPAGSA